LPAVDSATDGMLFVAPTHDDNNTNIAAAFPNNGGWTVSVREDDNPVFSGDANSLAATGQNNFQFLYVPYSAQGLVGGLVDGESGAMLQSAGNDLFDLTRTAAGDYSLSVYEADGVTKLDENDGMLILSVAGAASGAPTLADRKFMSYEYDATSGDFVIQSRELTAISQETPPSENIFGDVLSLRDVDFYFAWVDFANPLAPSASGIPGDYNESGTVDAADYVLWRKNLNQAVTLPNDLTPGMVENDDYDVWRANFGLGAPGSGGGQLVAQGVPEPTTIGLCALLMCHVAAARLRSRVAA